MKRHCLLAVLMLLSPSAYAGNSISFVVGGHRVHIEAFRHCRSISCASVSISGVYRSRDRYNDDDRYEDDRVDNGPVKPQPAPPIVVASPPAVYRPAAVATRIVAAPPPPPAAPAMPAVPPAPPPPPPVATPAESVRPAPPIARVSDVVEEEIDTPIGDWQTEGKGSVRIAKCGNALCGYVLNSSSNDKGEAVLINMKPRTDRQWSGSVYSQASGDTYYGTMNLRGANTLRVEACALGQFYCSGNNWSRIVARAESLMSSRQSVAEPRS
jgi:hypothetical protein